MPIPNTGSAASRFAKAIVPALAEMKTELYALAGTALFADVELVLDEIDIPTSAMPSRRVLRQTQEPVYAIVRQEGQSRPPAALSCVRF